MHAQRLVARLAWILPVFFLGLALHQGRAAYGLRATATSGTPATAEVLELHQENRVDVTYDYVSLRVTLPSGETLTRERLALPHSLAPRLEGKETVDVRVRPGRSQEVVVTLVANTQWRIAAMNSAIAAVAALLALGGVFYWNRHLARQGDPAARGVTEADPEHPARQKVRAQS
jgi:hypothetical protein